MPTSTFKKKCLLPGTRVCLRLKQLREQQDMSIKELSKKTRIAIDYLQALEECRFDDLDHSIVYKKNFIKKYVSALHEDPQPFLDQFNTEELTQKDKEKRNHPCIGCSKTSLTNMPNILKLTTIGVTVFGLLLYLGIHVHNILQAPELTLISPTDGYITEENNTTIKGNTQPETKIMVNEEPISNDEHGNFEQTINLSPGINTLVVTAKNKHGKISEEIRHVIYKTSELISFKNTQ